MHVDHFWNLLKERKPKKGGEYAAKTTGIELAGLSVLVALDGDGFRHLLLPIEEESFFQEDRKSSGVQVVLHELIDGGERRKFVDLVCRKPHLHEIFSILSHEVLQEIQNTSKPPHVICIEILEKWRDLLEASHSDLLSMAALKGLFGELWHLRMVINKRRESLDAWTGPDQHRHDFTRGKTALEIKTTSLKKGRSFEIHGHLQLEPSSGGKLYFAGMKIEQTIERGESVPDIVDSILSAGVPSHKFIEKLEACGYQMSHHDSYRGERFQVLEDRMYRVDENFPRIVRASFSGSELPPRIMALNYTIDLSGEIPVPISESEKNSVYSLLAGSKG